MNAMRLLPIAFVLTLFLSWSPTAEAQVVDEAAAGVELCDCLPADSYILLKKLKTVGGESTITYQPMSRCSSPSSRPMASTEPMQ